MDQQELIRNIAEDRARERQLARENAQRRKRLAKAAQQAASNSTTAAANSNGKSLKKTPSFAQSQTSEMAEVQRLGCAGSRPPTTSDHGLSSADAMSTCTTTTTGTSSTTFSRRVGQTILAGRKQDSYAAVQRAVKDAGDIAAEMERSVQRTRAPDTETGGHLPQSSSSPRAMLQQQQQLRATSGTINPSASLKEFVAIEHAVNTWAVDVEAPSSPALPPLHKKNNNAQPSQITHTTPADATVDNCGDVEKLPKIARPSTTEASSPLRGGAGVALLQRSQSAPSHGKKPPTGGCKPPTPSNNSNNEPKSIMKRFPLKKQLNVKNVQFSKSTKLGDTTTTVEGPCNAHGDGGLVQFSVQHDDATAADYGNVELRSPYTAEFIEAQCASAAANINDDFGGVDVGAALGSEMLFPEPSQSPSPLAVAGDGVSKPAKKRLVVTKKPVFHQPKHVIQAKAAQQRNAEPRPAFNLNNSLAPPSLAEQDPLMHMKKKRSTTTTSKKTFVPTTRCETATTEEENSTPMSGRIASVSASGTFHTGVTLEERALEEALANINRRMNQAPPPPTDDVHGYPSGVAQQWEYTQDQQEYNAVGDDDDAHGMYEYYEQQQQQQAVAAGCSNDEEEENESSRSLLSPEATAEPTHPQQKKNNVVAMLRQQAASRAHVAPVASTNTNTTATPSPLPMMNFNRNPLIQRGKPKVVVSTPLDGPQVTGSGDQQTRVTQVAGGPAASMNVVLPHRLQKDSNNAAATSGGPSSAKDAVHLPRRDLRSGKRISYVRPN